MDKFGTRRELSDTLKKNEEHQLERDNDIPRTFASELQQDPDFRKDKVEVPFTTSPEHLKIASVFQ